MPRILRHALACALFVALAAMLLPGEASAAPWGRSPSLPITDDGRRALRAGGGIVEEAMRFVGGGNPTGTRGPWCADYASMVLRETGHRPLASRMAGAALAYGPRTRNPKLGDLIVLGGRRRASHVGFFAGWDHGRVVMVSGNWSHRVSRAVIPARAVVAFVRT